MILQKFSLGKRKLTFRRGASMIIGMILTVLILTFSLSMAKTVVTTKGNIRKAIDAGELQIGRESAENRAERFARTGENPFDDSDDAPFDYSMIVQIGDNQHRQDVWASTGCPVPNRQSLDSDYQFDDNLFVGEDISGVDLDNPDNNYTVYSLDNPPQTTSLKNRCFGPNYNDQSKHYFVYPTPLANENSQVTVYNDCDVNRVNREIGNEQVNPLDHPCYWGRIEPGESASITINKLARELAFFDVNADADKNLESLFLRVRPSCPDGQIWCSQTERINRFIEIPLGQYSLDVSPLIANWELEVADGDYIYASSRGSIEDLEEELRIDDACPESNICRNRRHSEISGYNIVGRGPGQPNPRGNYLLDMLYLGDIVAGMEFQDLLENIDPFVGYLFPFSLDPSEYSTHQLNAENLKLNIYSSNRGTRFSQPIEYQVVSNVKLFR